MPPEPRRVGQQRREPLHPTVHREVIHFGAAFGQ
jgi:hypothetical protein